MVPSDIPGAMVDKQDGDRTVKVKATDGWLLKTKGINRSLAFWLNQGISFILIHSAYEHKNDEMSHALIPYIGEVPKDPKELPEFTWDMSKPLTALKAFTDSMAGARKLSRLTDINFEFALGEDAELIPASEKGGPLKASDAVALLPFQISRNKFALAAYIVTPTITVPLKPTEITVRVDKRLGDEILTVHTLTGMKGKATVLQASNDSTMFSLDIDDSVTMVVFETK